SISRATAPPSRTYCWLLRMPRLPPVPKSRQTRFRRTFSPGVGYSVVTLLQSHSSSSATSWASPVSVPCPISERAIRITTRSSGWIVMMLSSRLGRGMNRFSDLLVGAAAADIGHRSIDVRIARLRLGGKQRRRGHDHAALAIAALRHIEIEPSLLDLVQLAVFGEAFDGDDLLAADRVQRHLAGARGDTIDMDGAGAALGNAATILGAG